jgi:hypothetical protein
LEIQHHIHKSSKDCDLKMNGDEFYEKTKIQVDEIIKEREKEREKNSHVLFDYLNPCNEKKGDG